MQQAHDFLTESEALHALVAPLTDEELAQATAFKGWTVNDVIGHLHMWNQAADLSLTDEAGFQAFFAGIRRHVADGSLRQAETRWLDGLAGRALVEAWMVGCRDVAAHFAAADPSLRVKWAGPDMSARSSITARLMETWAHGQEVYDQLGVVRQNGDRIRNIVILGVNTYRWTFLVREQEPPEPVPFLDLEAPSGERWTFGEPNDAESIRGLAEQFCQVVTQVRNVADTSLDVVGPNANLWMSQAQCFAGPPETPPAPGTRRTRTGP